MGFPHVKVSINDEKSGAAFRDTALCALPEDWPFLVGRTASSASGRLVARRALLNQRGKDFQGVGVIVYRGQADGGEADRGHIDAECAAVVGIDRILPDEPTRGGELNQ